MANTTTNVQEKLLAQGALALRQAAVFAQLVNRDYQGLVSKKGRTIEIPIPSAIAARAVTPGVAYASNVDSSPTVALVTLNEWYEAPINLSDQDWAEADPMFLEMQGSEAIKALANNVDSYIFGKHIHLFGHTGTQGSTPFNGSLLNAVNARKALSIQLAPNDNRRGVIDPAAAANMLMVPNVLDTDKAGSRRAVLEGEIGRVIGVDWYENQNVTTFTPGAAWVTAYTVATGGTTAGASTISLQAKGGDLAGATTGAIKVGDLFTISGNQYTVKTAVATITVSSSAAFSVAVYPDVVAVVASGVAATVIGSAYTVNQVFHRDCYAFASRPLTTVFHAGNVFQLPQDPVSGIALRLELSRQYKQETLSYDILYGANRARPELGVKVLG